MPGSTIGLFKVRFSNANREIFLCNVYDISVLMWGRLYMPIKINNYVIHVYHKLLCNARTLSIFVCAIRLGIYALFPKLKIRPVCIRKYNYR